MQTTTPILSLATSTNSVESLREEFEALSKLDETALSNFLSSQKDIWTEIAGGDFISLALRHQLPPARANNGAPWTTWLLLGGRGAGKTRAGAEWVRRVALADGRARIALIAETEHEAREVMVEGVSGVLSVHRRSERPLWRPSRRRLAWKNGAVAQLFSAENPDALRGPQFSAAWLDELAKWRHAEATFNMLQFGLRLGERPRQVVTTTPRPTEFIKRMIADPRTALTHAETRVNAANLAPEFLETVLARYHGTELGRQEILGEIGEQREGALWTRALIEASRVREAPALRRIVVAVDPPGSSAEGSDACGLVAAGQAPDGILYVLADESARSLSPGLGRARDRAVAQAESQRADRGIQFRRRDGARSDRRGRSDRAGAHGARDTRQVSARRADRAALRAAPRAARGRIREFGRRDVRLRPGRVVLRPLARPPRRSGLGFDGAQLRREGGAADQGVVRWHKIRAAKSEPRVPGAPQREAVRCRPGTPVGSVASRSASKKATRAPDRFLAAGEDVDVEEIFHLKKTGVPGLQRTTCVLRCAPGHEG
jgi:phage terminase large subunit-like protein